MGRVPGAAGAVVGGRVLIRSRRGGDLTPAFPGIAAAAAHLPDDTALDGVM